MIAARIGRNAVLKLTFCLRRLPKLSLAEFQDYWLNKHGPLVRSLQPALGMVRYVQLHRLPGDLADGMRRVRGGPQSRSPRSRPRAAGRRGEVHRSRPFAALAQPRARDLRRPGRTATMI